MANLTWYVHYNMDYIQALKFMRRAISPPGSATILVARMPNASERLALQRGSGKLPDYNQ